MMRVIFTSVLALIGSAISVYALPCISFDANWNLYAFGVQGQSGWSLGTQDNWGSGGGNATTISTTNAPPFNGNNTQCFLAQFFNAIYVIDGDLSDPSSVHIFDADSQTWSIQTTNVQEAGVDPTSITLILDHDTNVFYGLQGNNLYQLDMSQENKATSSQIKWSEIGKPSFNTSGYTPTLGFANNHVYFLDVPGTSAGTAYIYVIHFSYSQPASQSYTPSSGNAFPAVGGKTATIWEPATSSTPTFEAPTEFAFFPSDGSGTYVVDVVHNTTVEFAAPPAPPSSGASFYAGSNTAIVQLTPSGEVYYLPVKQTVLASGTSATWTKVPNNLYSASYTSTTTAAPGVTIAGSTVIGATATGTSASTSASTTAKSGANKGATIDTMALFTVLVAGAWSLVA
ncbi:hypothetical protein FRB94_005380 [Tulasnella sp. JGI-2019a]|nr:hypothetical protein FRB94_005380 [Tulasnella sp. JGI-2019a]KAG9004486.1 hypothetical protein FRB93_010263 [Tulasnella sp. JGI-2019a]KAG9027956.1 hypothetical protein FRB95_007033 [Tulasnella sp. JGI-2019a]